MKIAFLILAHDRPRHLARLVGALQNRMSRVFIHVDRKADLGQFGDLENYRAVFLDNRKSVYWGGWSQVEAALALLRRAMDSGEDFSHFALLSGSDYPMHSVDWLLRYLRETRADHIDRVSFPSVSENKPWSRLAKRAFEGTERHHGYSAWLRLQGNRLLARLPDRPVRRILGDIQPFAGSQWWVLRRDSVSYVLDFVEAEGAIMKLFRHSHIPDEMFFQTVVSSMRDVNILRGLTYADWSKGHTGPDAIDSHHMAVFADPNFTLGGSFGDGPCFFARKFDDDREDLRLMMDRLILRDETDDAVADIAAMKNI